MPFYGDLLSFLCLFLSKPIENIINIKKKTSKIGQTMLKIEHMVRFCKQIVKNVAIALLNQTEKVTYGCFFSRQQRKYRLKIRVLVIFYQRPFSLHKKYI